MTPLDYARAQAELAGRVDVAANVAAVERPRRANLAAVRDALGDLELPDPREGWELLACRELIPAEWAAPWDDGLRCDHDPDDHVFTAELGAGVRAACDECLYARMPPRVFGGRGDKPSAVLLDLAHVTLFAADVPGVTQAEALAREFCARMARFGCPEPPRVRWLVDGQQGDRGRAEDTFMVRLTSQPWRQLGTDLDWTASAVERFDRLYGADTSAFAITTHVRDTWPSYRDAWMRREHWEADCAEHYDGAPNPFDPLVALRQLGYGIYDVREHYVYLIAPGLHG